MISIIPLILLFNLILKLRLGSFRDLQRTYSPWSPWLRHLKFYNVCSEGFHLICESYDTFGGFHEECNRFYKEYLECRRDVVAFYEERNQFNEKCFEYFREFVVNFNSSSVIFVLKRRKILLTLSLWEITCRDKGAGKGAVTPRH